MSNDLYTSTYNPDVLSCIANLSNDEVFTPPEVRERAEHYRPQLEAYSRALERVLERPVTRRTLYFLAAGETVDI